MAKKPKRPRDPNQLAKLILDITTGEAANDSPGVEPELTAPAAGFLSIVARRKGGMRGGKARADALSARERQEIARKAAQARWRKAKKLK